jgi:hypothetical protein
MRSTIRGLVAVASLALTACGARTDLGWFEGDGGAPVPDAEPDASGDFPCYYAPIGGFAPVAPLVRATHTPALAWGATRLAVTFVDLEEPNPRAASCTVGPETDWQCEWFFGYGPTRPAGGAVAWNGRHFAACWSDSERDGQLWAVRFDETAVAVDQSPRDLFVGASACLGLAWNVDRWVVLAGLLPEPAIGAVATLSEDLRDVSGTTYLGVPGPPTARPTLTGDAERAFAAWGQGSDIVWTLVSRTSHQLHVVPGAPRGADLAIALRGDTMGVLYAEPAPAGRAVRMALYDLSTSATSAPVELGTCSATAGVALVATGEGFVAAWMEDDGARQRLVAVPTREHEGLSLEVRTGIAVHEGPRPAGLDGPSPPSLAYDGLDVYLAATAAQEGESLPEVRLQRLACHR